jgi:hypothetical protein
MIPVDLFGKKNEREGEERRGDEQSLKRWLVPNFKVAKFPMLSYDSCEMGEGKMGQRMGKEDLVCRIFHRAEWSVLSCHSASAVLKS